MQNSHCHLFLRWPRLFARYFDKNERGTYDPFMLCAKPGSTSLFWNDLNRWFTACVAHLHRKARARSRMTCCDRSVRAGCKLSEMPQALAQDDTFVMPGVAGMRPGAKPKSG